MVLMAQDTDVFVDWRKPPIRNVKCDGKVIRYQEKEGGGERKWRYFTWWNWRPLPIGGGGEAFGVEYDNTEDLQSKYL